MNDLDLGRGMPPREMILGVYLSYGTGHHAGSWRAEESNPRGAQDIGHYLSLARAAERSCFDFIFLSDTPSVFADDRDGFGSRVVVFEPMTLLSAVAVSTTDIGLIATGSTTYKEPYNLAREYASLDLISGGRAGWNLVTSSKSAAAANFGLDKHPEHDDRYARAREFFEVVCRLWDSWEDDAFPRDKASGLFYNPTKRHPVDYQGDYFDLSGGLLNISRPPQGRPLIVQAGASEAGRSLAAASAELVFTAADNIEQAREFYRDVKDRAIAVGRDPNAIQILPGLSPYCAATRAEAEDRFADLQTYVHPTLALSMLSDLVGGFDLSGCDIDGPLPDLPPSNGNQSRRAMIDKMAKEPGITIRDLYQRLVVSRGHLTLIGSHAEVAETMSEWVETGAADGFNIMPPLMPRMLNDFATGVVPILQEQGRFKRSYRPGTLREKLGLERPEHAHVV